MAKRNSLSVTSLPAPIAETRGDVVNIIHDRLNQAHATVDLIYSMTSQIDCTAENFESLCKNTLNSALHSVMLRIEEAMEAAERIGVTHG